MVDRATLRFAELVENVYREELGVDLGEVHYCLTGLNSSCVAAGDGELDAAYKIFSDSIEGKGLFTSQGEKILPEDERFMKRPVVFLANKYDIAHELSHVGFFNLWTFDYSPWEFDVNAGSEIDYNFFKKHRTLNEGVAMNVESSDIFKRHYSGEQLQKVKYQEGYYNEKFDYFDVCKHLWMGGKGRINLNDARSGGAGYLSQYFIGNVFIKNVWDGKSSLTSLVNKLKKDIPTDEEVICPEKYLERFK